MRTVLLAALFLACTACGAFGATAAEERPADPIVRAPSDDEAPNGPEAGAIWSVDRDPAPDGGAAADVDGGAGDARADVVTNPFARYVIDCSDGHCGGATVACDAKRACEVRCLGAHTCEGTTIRCPLDYVGCLVACEGDDACTSLTVEATTPGNLCLQCRSSPCAAGATANITRTSGPPRTPCYINCLNGGTCAPSFPPSCEPASCF